MNYKTREEQIKLLQTIGSPTMARNIGLVLTALCIAFCATAIYQREWFFAFLALMFGGIGLAGKKSLLLVQNAAKAWRQGRCHDGAVTLTKITGGDTDEWNGILSVNGRKWQMRFVAPHGWEPDTGDYKVKAYCLDDVAWPHLLVADQGILYLRQEPKPAP